VPSRNVIDRTPCNYREWRGEASNLAAALTAGGRRMVRAAPLVARHERAPVVGW
jgi:fibrillarin-like rRNA methylase